MTTVTAGVAPTFEADLVEALQPIRGFALAAAIRAFFDVGLFAAMEQRAFVGISAMAESLALDAERVRGFLLYLHVEGFVTVAGDAASVTAKALRFKPILPWYEMLIGGYGETFGLVGQGLRLTSEPLPRRLEDVASGSCGISHYDSIPLTKALISGLPSPPRTVLDLGCGNALYLAELCQAIPGISAIGVEPSYEAFERAKAIAAERGCFDMISLHNSTAQDYVRNATGQPSDVDVVVLGFVLHEILGQEGEQGVRSFLSAVRDRYPRAHLVVIEVENAIEDPSRMEHELAKAYYNPYYLLHYFTKQRLESVEFWLRLFNAVGYRVMRRESPSELVDSTKLEHGFLLEAGR